MTSQHAVVSTIDGDHFCHLFSSREEAHRWAVCYIEVHYGADAAKDLDESLNPFHSMLSLHEWLLIMPVENYTLSVAPPATAPGFNNTMGGDLADG